MSNPISMKFISTLLCILAINSAFLKLQAQQIEQELLRLEYAVWQAADVQVKNRALLSKLSFQLSYDTNYAATLQSFDRLSWRDLEDHQKRAVSKNKAVFHFLKEEWEAAAQNYYDYMAVNPMPTLEDSMQYYYLSRFARGDFMDDPAWKLFLLDSNRKDCFECLEEVLTPLRPAKWPKYLNYAIPGSGIMALGNWPVGSGSLLLNAIGVTGAYVLMTAGLPVNAFFWAGSWEILFYTGSQRVLSKNQLEKEVQKKAGLSMDCQARWDKWIQSLQYEPFI